MKPNVATSAADEILFTVPSSPHSSEDVELVFVVCDGALNKAGEEQSSSSQRKLRWEPHQSHMSLTRSETSSTTDLAGE